MSVVFIYAHNTDRKFALALAKKFRESEPDLDVKVAANWLPAIFKRRSTPSDINILLWSKRSTKSPLKWLPRQAQQFLAQHTLFSAIVDGTAPPAQFGITQQSSPFLPNGTIDELGFFQLAHAIMMAMGNAERARIYEFRLGWLKEKVKPRKRERRIYGYRDLEDLCETVMDKVKDYAPDILFSFDARGGLWAQHIAEKLAISTERVIPVIVGFRLKPTGPRKSSICFDECQLVQTKRWHLFVPPALHTLPKLWPNWPCCRILYVDDYASSGDTCVAFRDYVIERMGADQDKVRTLTLISTDEAEEGQKAPDIFAHKTDAERADLFYMFRR